MEGKEKGKRHRNVYSKFEGLYLELEINFGIFRDVLEKLYAIMRQRGMRLEILDSMLETLMYEFLSSLASGGFTPSEEIADEFNALLEKLKERHIAGYI
jgi:hypothetical protein